MNNEPVAWMIIDVDNGKSLQFKENKFSEINIPLYTTPQIKELSDEEIKAIANNLTCTPDKNWNVLFARAILKKASFACNGFCGEYECKENQDNCKRLKKASEK